MLRDSTDLPVARYTLPNRFKVVGHISPNLWSRRTRIEGTTPLKVHQVAGPPTTLPTAAITESYLPSAEHRSVQSTFEHAQSRNPTIVLRSSDRAGVGWDAPSSRVRVPNGQSVELAHRQVAGTAGTPAPRNVSRATASTSMNPTSSGTSAADDLISSSSSQQNGVLDSRGQRSSGSFHHCSDGTAAGFNAPDTETNGEYLPEIRQVVPGGGPTTGGSPVVILGFAFPCIPLYVRFGDAVTRAVSSGCFGSANAPANITLRHALTPIHCGVYYPRLLVLAWSGSLFLGRHRQTHQSLVGVIPHLNMKTSERKRKWFQLL